MRQQVPVLHLSMSALDSDIVGGSRYDGTGRTCPTTGDSDEPPYPAGLAALRDGWRLFQSGHEYDVSFLSASSSSRSRRNALALTRRRTRARAAPDQ